MVLAADGLLERDVSLKTGQTVTVPVVPNGVAGANGVTWRRACYNAVHCGVLGAHRSADVTTKLLERAVWWPDLAQDVAAWVSRCLACIKGRSRPTKVEARAVKCGAETCWQEVSVDCEGPNREDREGLRYSLTYFDCLSHAVLLEPMQYVIDNTPGPHGYTPRDLERSWSLALPLERDVLRAALEFEPVSDWARGQFQQFAELSAAVKAHWDKSSAARAKLANRHRLKPGDRVVWNAPKARSEG
ncbi:pol, partial [Symbiodinium microadriaticum]